MNDEEFNPLEEGGIHTVQEKEKETSSLTQI